MKKLVSLLALCALCIGAVAMVTACGSKPAKKSVWKVTTSTYKSNRSGDQAPKVTKPDDYYICFHSDGMAYYTEKENGKLGAQNGIIPDGCKEENDDHRGTGLVLYA